MPPRISLFATALLLRCDRAALGASGVVCFTVGREGLRMLCVCVCVCVCVCMFVCTCYVRCGVCVCVCLCESVFCSGALRDSLAEWLRR